MTDPSKRPLTFPKWHIPYLEKHRISELFHELARELIIQKPEDHILFMKQMLQQASDSRDASKIILIGSHKINRVAIAHEIAKFTQQVVITSSNLKNIFGLDSKVNAVTVARAIACTVRSQNVASSGWIIADCINTEEDAKALQQLGVLPTHVIHLVTPFQPKLDELLYCDIPENWPELRRNLFALKEVFTKKIREISLAEKDIKTVAKNCIDICGKKPAIKTVRPRLVLLGPKGSGRKTQARLLSSMLGLVHVDFEYLLCQAWMSETELGKRLRECSNRVCFHSELLSQIVNKRILERDCMENGWVLTGFPYTVTDFQFLDTLQTPPNRVIVLDGDLNAAKERFRHKYVNAHTGSTVDLRQHASNQEKGKSKTEVSLEDACTNILSDNKVLKKHPKDNLDMLEAEHNFYCHNYGSIKKYCGNTLFVVNADQQERWVYECILSYLVGGNPPGPPRKGFGTEIPEVCSCDCLHIPARVTKTYTVAI